MMPIKKNRSSTGNGTTGHTLMKKVSRCRSFHFRYLELCRSKNITPLPEVRGKNNSTQVLDFFGDKINVTDWLLIMEALFYDQVLQTLAIRMRRCLGNVLDQLDTENKAKLYRQKPVLYTKFVFNGVIEGVANCIEFNKNLSILALEGLPLNDKYIEFVAKALTSNESLKEISFERSNLGDNGCEAVCNTIKYLENVRKLNLSECGLTTKGAEYVADMIKTQKISRYSEGWQKSLRYRAFDPESIKGLRSIAIARNPKIGDDGLKAIVEILKEDCWIKYIDMENCGLSDRSANAILDCLEINNHLLDFVVKSNPDISKFLLRSIREHFGKDENEQNLLERQHDPANGAKGVKKNLKTSKLTVSLLKEKLKTLEEQLAFERVLRKKAERLNEKLNQQILACENQMQEDEEAAEAAQKNKVPEGYVLVKTESLQSIIRERNDYQQIAQSICPTRANTPRLVLSTSDRDTNIIDIEPIAPPPSSRSTKSHLNSPVSPNNYKDPRKSMKVRKVKSEMKYLEQLNSREPTKKKESKSDHEFANENDFQLSRVQFETNIGDTTANNGAATAGSAVQDIAVRSNMGDHKKSPSNAKMLEVEDLNLITSRSVASENGNSTDSDTLRNTTISYTPFKVFVKHTKQGSVMHHGNVIMNRNQYRETTIANESVDSGDKEPIVKRKIKKNTFCQEVVEELESPHSARSFFLGMDDED